jgi:hypothetical protein
MLILPSADQKAASVRPFKLNSLTLFLVIALMGIMVVVLILPDVDLPDTAFQRNSSLQALRSLCYQMPHASAKAHAVHLSLEFEDTSIPPREVHETRVQCSNDLPILHEALRC